MGPLDTRIPSEYSRDGMKFDDAIFEAGKSRFRAIFLTSITTIAGLAPLLLEKSRQAQFLKPMAISIAYGIGFATILTLLMLPIFLAFNNNVKVGTKWLKTGKKVSKEEVERAIKEQKEELHMQQVHLPTLNGNAAQHSQKTSPEPESK